MTVSGVSDAYFCATLQDKKQHIYNAKTENKIVVRKNKTQDLGVEKIANTRYIMFEITKKIRLFLFNMHKSTAFAFFPPRDICNM